MPSSHEHMLFRKLKEQLSQNLRERHPEVPENIEDWKGNEIALFQQDLMAKANGRVSEKWFYTHIKNSNGNIPRIDILNLLSQYAGHQSWNAFKTKNRKLINKKMSWWKVFVPTGILVMLFNFYEHRPGTYQFCLIDAYSQQPLTAADMEVWQLKKNESPLKIALAETGCFSLKGEGNQVHFAIVGPYYLGDTLIRNFPRKKGRETIELKSNDYAMMISAFSRKNMADWQRRRNQLDLMISESAVIIQLQPEAALSMEMYNKQEFIDKMTTPIKSLKNIRIVEIKHQHDQIIEMKFVQDNRETP